MSSSYPNAFVCLIHLLRISVLFLTVVAVDWKKKTFGTNYVNKRVSV